MEPNLKHHLKKMGKHDQIVAAQTDRPAIYVNFYQNFVTITYSIHSKSQSRSPFSCSSNNRGRHKNINGFQIHIISSRDISYHAFRV
jgi:hypothetical protein